MKVNRLAQLALVIFLTALLAGCASRGPTIFANNAADIDLTAFRTWNFMQPLGTDRPNGVRSPLSSTLMASVQREMEARGLTRSDEPDVLVDFFVTTEQRMDVRTTPTSSVSRPHWRHGWYSTWPSYQTTVRRYTVGTLLIDLIDPRANALVAEGAATNRLRGNEFTQGQSDDVVGLILREMWPR